ncbi:hypothetical protein BDZ45DRAFT_767228, partial [Acephala macrosclerotiorum]
ISDQLGPKLDSEELIDIADSFLSFDLISLSVCQSVFEKVLAGGLNADDPDARPSAVTNLEKIAAVRDEAQLIQNGQQQFRQDFLKNPFLINYEGKGLSLLSQMVVQDPNMHQPVRTTFDSMVSKVLGVPEMLVKAQSRGALDSETRVALRRRWMKIKEMCDFMDARHAKPSIVNSKIETNFTDRIQVGSPSNSGDTLTVLQSINTILWATFISNIVLTIPFLWKAYEFSSHSPGTQYDADFWFLVQSCASQLVGLLISALGLYRKSSVSMWMWVLPIVFAAICNIVAMPLYLKVPTEWSSYCVVVAGAIQSFMVLQLAIAGE